MTIFSHGISSNHCHNDYTNPVEPRNRHTLNPPPPRHPETALSHVGPFNRVFVISTPINLDRPQDTLRRIRSELDRLVRLANDGRGDSAETRPATLRVFESFDRRGSGRVSRRDFRHALTELGFNYLGDEEAGEILDYFDPHR